jgi:hypothetical protein
MRVLSGDALQRRAWLLALACAALPACHFNDARPGNPPITCGEDGDCPQGLVCASWRECVSQRDDVLRDAFVSPVRGTTGTVFTFRFSVTAALPPRVRLLTAAGASVGQPEVEQVQPGQWRATWVAPADAPQVELRALVDVELSPTHDQLLGLALGALTIDRTPPALAQATVEYLPDQANPLVRLGLKGMVAAATSGTQVSYTLAFAEPTTVRALVATPVAVSAPPLAFLVQSLPGGLGAIATALVTPGLADGPWRGVVTLADDLGNAQDVALPAFEVDQAPPPAPDVDGQQLVVFRRAPWGDAQSPSRPRFTLRGRAGATVGLGVVEVFVNDLALGRVRTDAQGGFDELALGLYADTHAVRVRFDDLAGNQSPLVHVKDFELAVVPTTLAGAPPNPLTVWRRPVAEPCGASSGDVQVTDTSMLVTADGVSCEARPGWRRVQGLEPLPTAQLLETTDVRLAFETRNQVLRAVGVTPRLVSSTPSVLTWRYWSAWWTGEGWATDWHYSLTTTVGQYPRNPPELQGLFDDLDRGLLAVSAVKDAVNNPYEPDLVKLTFLRSQVSRQWPLASDACGDEAPGNRGNILLDLTRFGATLSDRFTPGQGWAHDPVTDATVSAGGGAATWDPARQVVVRFGDTLADGGPVAVTLTRQDNLWLQRTPAHAPPARTGAAMTWEPEAQRVLLLGGRSETGALLADAWAWDGVDWSPFDAGLLVPLAGAAAAYEPRSRSLVLAGGFVAGPDGGLVSSRDTWVRRAGAWRLAGADGGVDAGPAWAWQNPDLGDQQLAFPPVPGPAWLHADEGLVWYYDENLGSWSVPYPVNNLYAWSTRGPVALAVEDDAGSAARVGPAFATNGVEAVLLGGQGVLPDGGPTQLDDTQRWRPDAGWQGVAGAHPDGQLRGVLAAEDGTGRFLFHGQALDAGLPAQTWVLEDAGWQLASTTGPTLRGDEALWWNPWAHGLQLLGGALPSPATFRAGAWVFDPAPGATAWAAPHVGYDARSGRALLLAGGLGTTGFETSDGHTWRVTDVPRVLLPNALHSLGPGAPLTSVSTSGPGVSVTSSGVTPALDVRVRTAGLAPADARFTGVRVATTAGATAGLLEGVQLRPWFETGWGGSDDLGARNTAAFERPAPLEWARTDEGFMTRLLGDSRVLAFEVRPLAPRGDAEATLALDAVEAVLSYRWVAP